MKILLITRLLQNSNNVADLKKLWLMVIRKFLSFIVEESKIFEIHLTPPDMENVENRRISVRTYRLLAILSCHINVL